MKDIKEWTMVAAGVLVVIVFVINLSWVLPSYLEARAFNNVTGKDVSTIDAMFLSLRVDCD